MRGGRSFERKFMTNPVVHVANRSNQEVCIAHDPNWDEQVLRIDGSASAYTLCLEPGVDADVSIDVRGDTTPEAYLMGVIFSDGKDFTYGRSGAYQTTIGHHPNTGLLGVTDESTIRTPSVQYVVSNQTPWSMNMTFDNA
jgi:hypothetical protein